jgi:hypothetical protein
MASRRRRLAPEGDERDSLSASADKIARLLALVVTRDLGTDEATVKLIGVGFSPQEICDLLGVTTNYVNVVKHRSKRRKTPRKRH